MQAKKLFSVLALSLVGLTSCDKGGSTFSIASESSQFKQAATYVPRKLDVLFVIDNSGSMKTSQDSLSANFPSFIKYFRERGYDFKLAITTSDAFYGDQFKSTPGGCIQSSTGKDLCLEEQTRFKGSVMDITTKNLDATFSANAQVGINGSGDERAFSSFKAALTSPLNADFHRKDAYLSIVIISDEEDFSHDDIGMNEDYNQATLHSIESYKTFLETFTQGQASSDFSVSTISVIDEDCKTTLNAGAIKGRKIGLRLMQLADLTGGSQNSLCSPFDTALNNISTSIAGSTNAQFKLDRKPVLESIRVIINGQVIPMDAVNGWSYDATKMTITIRGSASPNSGDDVKINFDPDIT